MLEDCTEFRVQAALTAKVAELRAALPRTRWRV